MKTLNLKSVKTNGYKIEFSLNGKNQPVACVYKMITSGKNKGTEKYVDGYCFLNEASREAWVKKQVDQIVADANKKAAAAELQKEAASKNEHPYKVGAVLYDSWGYEQTNVNFWQVVENKGKSIILREIGAEVVSQTGHDSGRKKPVMDRFIGEPELKRVIVKVYNDLQVRYSVSSRFGGSLSLYDGGDKGVYYSWGY